MRTHPVLLGAVVAGAVVLGSQAHAQSDARGEQKAWGVPSGRAQGQSATGGVGVPELLMDPATVEAAEAILEREEAAAGRQFDGAYRATALAKLAAKSTEELDEIAGRVGGTFLGSQTGDFVYNPVPPCRVIDTRLAGGVLAAGTSRNFRVTGAGFTGQGGFAGSCGIPFGPATAVMINFVAAGATANGNLSATPYPQAFPTSSIINWTTGFNTANGLTAAICNPGLTTCTFDISIQANISPIHVVADVMGYFAAPFTTSLDVQIVFTPFFGCSAFFDCSQFQNCNTGYTITGGGCQLQTFSPNTWTWSNNSPAGTTNGWVCQGTNSSSTTTQNMRTYAMCSRVPGR